MEVFGSMSDILGIGDGPQSLAEWQVALRTVIVYAFSILLLRIGDKRFLGKNTAFDVILGFILGSVLSRAVTGNSAFLATLVAASMLVGLHWLLAITTFHFDGVGNVVKGIPRLLIKDGVQQSSCLRGSHISRNDILQALRIDKGTEDLSTVDQAYLERSGDISIIPKQTTSQVIEVNVKNGVQVIRVEWVEQGS